MRVVAYCGSVTVHCTESLIDAQAYPCAEHFSAQTFKTVSAQFVGMQPETYIHIQAHHHHIEPSSGVLVLWCYRGRFRIYCEEHGSNKKTYDSPLSAVIFPKYEPGQAGVRPMVTVKIVLFTKKSQRDVRPNFLMNIIFLPPASAGWRGSNQVIFSVCVSVHTSTGGGGGTPFPGPGVWGWGGGTPCPRPCQIPGWGGGGRAGSGGTPHLGQITGQGYPLLGQHSVYLLHGGRYASSVHAEGLSCYFNLHPAGTSQISDQNGNITNFWLKLHNGSLWEFQIFNGGDFTGDITNQLLALIIVY